MASSAALTGPALREAKRNLRAAVIARRDALPPDERLAAARQIAVRVMGLPAYVAARTVLITLPFRSEWDTWPVALAALAAGKRVLVPRVDPAARVLSLHWIDSLREGIAPGYRGIPEPRADAPRAEPSEVHFALVPGVAFDASGRRLGYGGGYYDRLLPLMRAGVARVAGAFDVQVVDAVPAAAHDLTVDMLVTPTRILKTVPP